MSEADKPATDNQIKETVEALEGVQKLLRDCRARIDRAIAEPLADYTDDQLRAMHAVERSLEAAHGKADEAISEMEREL